MMDLHIIDQLLEHASRLTPSERLLLASRLIQGVRNEMPSHQSQRKWKDVAGLLQYPALGEDAQAYFSRSRRADTERRIKIIRDGE
jgi:hypothetical protein